MYCLTYDRQKFKLFDSTVIAGIVDRKHKVTKVVKKVNNMEGLQHQIILIEGIQGLAISRQDTSIYLVDLVNLNYCLLFKLKDFAQKVKNCFGIKFMKDQEVLSMFIFDGKIQNSKKE